MAAETYILTGGGGALAGSIARVFGEAGARLSLVDSAAERVEARARELGADWFAADLTSADEARRVVDGTLTAAGRLDGLIHTAGGFAMAQAWERDEALYDRMLDANFRTTVTAVQACLPHFLRQGSGFIAAVSSHVVWNGEGAAGMAIYAAAKAALTFYLRSVNREVRRSGVRVAIVYPMAAIDTPANRAAMPDADPATWVDPDEIARVLLFASQRSDRGLLLELPIGVGGAAVGQGVV
jgi:NAD(P)-dependent dehydrogenase (short-subunit alcohol dehydrogenase family)